MIDSNAEIRTAGLKTKDRVGGMAQRGVETTVEAIGAATDALSIKATQKSNLMIVEEIVSIKNKTEA